MSSYWNIVIGIGYWRNMIIGILESGLMEGAPFVLMIGNR